MNIENNLKREREHNNNPPAKRTKRNYQTEKFIQQNTERLKAKQKGQKRNLVEIGTTKHKN